MRRRPPDSPLFPHTTLSRSRTATVPEPQPPLVDQPSAAPSRKVAAAGVAGALTTVLLLDRKSTRLNSSHANISYAVFCLKKKTNHRPSGWTGVEPPQATT